MVFPLSLPFLFDLELFYTLFRSYIEALHHINNMLQIRFFRQKRCYVYEHERKLSGSD